MYALVEDNSITKIFPGPKGFEHNGNQYAPDIFYKWSKAEKEAIGLYEVETDNTNYKNKEWYNNTTGQFISILVIQDGTGSRTLTWNAVFEFASDTAPTLTTTANLGDVFVFRYNGSKWLEVGRNQALTLS